MMEPWMHIWRIGDPFVPRSGEGVCVHVLVADPRLREPSHLDVRVLVLARGATPSAQADDAEAAGMANETVREDMGRRSELYDAAFSELEKKRHPLDDSSTR